MGGGGIDIRVPIGLMFFIVGAIITGYGAATNGDDMYSTHSLGININLWWGLCLILFALVMLALAWNAARKHKKEIFSS
jgi:drug/metabolite transporter (DMT)-like permease